MRKPLATTLALVVFLVALEFTVSPRVAATITPQQGVRILSDANDASSASFGTGLNFGSRLLVSPSAAARVTKLSVDDTALVAAICDLQLLAHDTDLALDSAQWTSLAKVVLQTQAVQQTYEAQIARAKWIAPGKYRVEIPDYVKAGQVLRAQFNADLRAALGAAAATEVLGNLGDRLEMRFAGFGVSAQTLDISAGPRDNLRDLEVVRTVTYWNSVEGSDQLTTRREIHFPADEDPSGDRWGALLAMVKA